MQLVKSNYTDTQVAFTLVELLVAMAIFGILSAMGYGSLSNILSLQSRQQQVQQAQEDLQRALLILARDFYQIVPRPVRDNLGKPENAFRYDSNNNTVEFTKSGNFQPIKFRQSSLQRIGYSLEGDILYRQHWTALDRPVDATVSKYPILKSVSALNFRFLNAKKEWSKFWQPQGLTDLPFAIAVEIELTDGSTFLHTFPVLQIPA